MAPDTVTYRIHKYALCTLMPPPTSASHHLLAGTVSELTPPVAALIKEQSVSAKIFADHHHDECAGYMQVSHCQQCQLWHESANCIHTVVKSTL